MVDVTCGDCWIDNWGSYSDKIVLCPLHAAAEATAKQRNQLLEAAIEADSWADQLGTTDSWLATAKHQRLKAAIAAAQPEKQEV